MANRKDTKIKSAEIPVRGVGRVLQSIGAEAPTQTQTAKSGDKTLAMNESIAAVRTTPLRGSDERLKRRLPRSGGPRTPEGKAKSARNSLKHFGYAKHLPDWDGYYDLINAARLELQISGKVEASVADSFAHETYRRMLIEECEMVMIKTSEFKRLDPDELARRMDFPFGEEYQHLLEDPPDPSQLFRDFSSMWRELAAPPVAGAGGQLETKEDGRVVRLYESACKLFVQAEHNPYVYGEVLEKIDRVMIEAMQGKNYLGRRISAQGREIMLVNYWLIVNRQELSICMHDMRSKNKLVVLNDDNLGRAKRHVNASIKSTLDQLARIREIKFLKDERMFPKKK